MRFGFDLSYVALWGLVIFQSLVLLGLVRQSAETRRKLAEIGSGGALAGRLELGTKAPDFTAVEARSGRTVRRGDLAGQRSILLFLAPGCRNCDKLAAGIHGIYHKAEGRLYLVCQGSREACLAFLGEHGMGIEVPVLLDPELGISGRFRIFGAPAAVMLDSELRIRSYGSPKEHDDLARIVLEAAAGEVDDPAGVAAEGPQRR